MHTVLLKTLFPHLYEWHFHSGLLIIGRGKTTPNYKLYNTMGMGTQVDTCIQLMIGLYLFLLILLFHIF